MSKKPYILAFAASNSRQSINKRFAEHAGLVLQKELAPEVTLEMIDLNDYEMPIYSPDRENAGGIPQAARDFYAKIGGAEALIISFAEHNGAYTAAFKNIFDWVSRIDMKVYQGKPMLALATSPGPGGGQNVLQAAVGAAPFFGGDIKGSLSVGPYGEHFDAETGVLNEPGQAAALREALRALMAVKKPA